MKVLRRFSNLTLVIAASALIIVLGLFDLTKDRLPSSSFLETLSGRNIYAWVPKSIPSTLEGITPNERPRFAVNSGVVQISELWALTGKPGKWNVTSWSLSDRKLLTRDNRNGTTLVGRDRIDYPSEIGDFDVSPWSNVDNNLMIFDPVGRRLRIRRIPIAEDVEPKAVKAGMTPPLAPLADGSRRTLSMARFSGALPDLYVIDSRRDLRWEISVYSGESGFSKKLDSWLTTRVVSGELLQGEWQVDMVESPEDVRPDLNMLTRGIESGSNHTEIHVLTESSGFRKFPTQIPVDLNGELPADHQLLLVPRYEDPDAENGDIFGTILHIFPRRGEMEISWLPFGY